MCKTSFYDEIIAAGKLHKDALLLDLGCCREWPYVYRPDTIVVTSPFTPLQLGRTSAR